MPPPADPAPAGGGGAARAILRGGAANAAGFLIRFGARFAFLFVAARLYGVALLGAYAVALAVVEIAVMAGLVGARWLIFQWLDARGGRAPRRVIGDAALLVGGASGLVAVAVIAFALLAPVAPASGAALLWLAPTIVVQAWIELLLAATRWTGIVRHDVAGKSLVQPWVGLAAALAAWGAGWREVGLPLSYLAASLATLGYAAWSVARTIPPGAVGGDGSIRAMAAQGWPVALGESVDGLLGRLDLALVGALLGEAAAGVYGMAKQIAVVVRQVRQSFDGMLVPLVARTAARADDAATGAAVASAVRLILVVQTPVVIAFAAIGAPLLAAFGPAFAAGYAALLILALAELVQGAFGVSDLIFAYRRPRLGLVVTLAGVAAAAAVAVPAIDALGVSGAALALLAGYVVRVALRRSLLARAFGVTTPLVAAAVPAGIGGVAIAAALALREWPIAALAAGVTLFAALLFAWLRATNASLMPRGFVDELP